jgi:hypothetical protein
MKMMKMRDSSNIEYIRIYLSYAVCSDELRFVDGEMEEEKEENRIRMKVLELWK